MRSHIKVTIDSIQPFRADDDERIIKPSIVSGREVTEGTDPEAEKAKREAERIAREAYERQKEAERLWKEE